MMTCTKQCTDWMKNYADVAPLVLRVVLGVIFFYHGWQKLTVMKLAGTTGFLAMLHIPLPSVFAVLLIATEVLGGLALVVGICTHWAAKLGAIVALVALFTVHLQNGFAVNPGAGMGGYGYEFILLILAASVSLMVTGAGKYSLDAKCVKKDMAMGGSTGM